MTRCLLVVILFCFIFSINADLTVLIDCGSTGSRIYVYQYERESALSTIAEKAHLRIKPGLSSFVGDDEGLAEHVRSLLTFAVNHIPRNQLHNTTISLKATAGLRELSQADQDHLIAQASKELSASQFLHIATETRVISGEEEALFGLLGIMPALGLSFDEHLYAVADLGGSSQQIAFVYASKNGEHDLESCPPDFVLNVPGYGSLSILARSLRQMGLLAAMDHVLQQGLARRGECSTENMGFCEVVDSQLPSCLPPAPKSHLPVEGPMSVDRQDAVESFHGSGNFSTCVENIKEFILPKLHDLIEFECVRSNLPHTIIAIDNFPKLIEMLHLSSHSDVTPDQVASAGQTICTTPWEDNLDLFPGYISYRAQRACFGSAFIFVLMTELYGMQVNGTTATKFRAVNEIGQQELGWAAGAAVYSAMSLHIDHWSTPRTGQLPLGGWTIDPDVDGVDQFVASDMPDE